MSQLKLFDMPKDPNVITAYDKQKWRLALQKYCNDNANGQTGYCICGAMNYCDLCMGSEKPNACVNAILYQCRNKNINVDYKNYDFEKFIERVESV